MGLTAEAVAKEFGVSREDQDEFSYRSHQKAIRAIAEGYFKSGILPVSIEEIFVDPIGKSNTISPTLSALPSLKTVKEDIG